MVKEIIIGMALVIIGSLVASPGAIFFKKASQNLGKNIFKLLKIKEFYIGAILFVLSTLFFVPGLKYGELSILYPVASFSYIWVALLSIHFLKEKMNISKWAGILLIIGGVVLIGLGS